jgi:large subunit ribosomal protein L29
MKIAEIREFTLKELAARKREIRQEIFNLRIQQQGGQLEKPHMLRSLRRDAARVESVLTQKRKAAQSAASPVESRPTTSKP